MPANYKKVEVDELEGLICDSCDKDCTSDASDSFVVNYSYGYGTGLDGCRVEFALCDHCLTHLAANYIKNVKFYKDFNKEMPILDALAVCNAEKMIKLK